MIEIEILYLWASVMILVGGGIIWWHGSQQYGKGILDGIQMHHSGRLTYTVYEEEGQEMLAIKIKEEDED